MPKPINSHCKRAQPDRRTPRMQSLHLIMARLHRKMQTPSIPLHTQSPARRICPTRNEALNAREQAPKTWSETNGSGKLACRTGLCSRNGLGDVSGGRVRDRRLPRESRPEAGEKFGGKVLFGFFLGRQKETARPARGRQRNKEKNYRKSCDTRRTNLTAIVKIGENYTPHLYPNPQTVVI